MVDEYDLYFRVITLSCALRTQGRGGYSPLFSSSFSSLLPLIYSLSHTINSLMSCINLSLISSHVSVIGRNFSPPLFPSLFSLARWEIFVVHITYALPLYLLHLALAPTRMRACPCKEERMEENFFVLLSLPLFPHSPSFYSPCIYLSLIMPLFTLSTLPLSCLCVEISRTN